MEKHEESVSVKEVERSEPVGKNDAPEASIEKAGKTKKKIDLKKYRKPALLAVGLLAVLAAAYQYKGVFVSAVVNGSPISRLSVIRELEKEAGQQALDRLITKKLIAAEVARKKIVVTPSDIDAEVKKIGDSVTKQGGTLEEALAQQGMTEGDLREQMLMQKELEKILGNKVKVTDEDVTRYVTQSKAAAPAGMSDADFMDQIREQLKSQKFNDEVGKWIAAAKAKASIRYYAGYAAGMDAVPAEADEDAQAE